MACSHDEVLETILRLRVAVAYLGEKDQCAWWSTKFLGAGGLRFLEYPYPRSAFAAGVTAASETAKSFHDSRIGKGRVTHLFRLPHLMEQRLRSMLLSPVDTDLRSILADQDAAMKALDELADERAPAHEGPVRIGDATMLASGAAIPKIAAYYTDAFKTKKQTLPYFTAEAG